MHWLFSSVEGWGQALCGRVLNTHNFERFDEDMKHDITRSVRVWPGGGGCIELCLLVFLIGRQVAAVAIFLPLSFQGATGAGGVANLGQNW